MAIAQPEPTAPSRGGESGINTFYELTINFYHKKYFLPDFSSINLIDI